MYDETVSSYTAKMFKNVKLQIKEHFFDPKDPIFVTGFLATSKLVYDTNCIHEEVAMWVLSHYITETVANALNNRMCTTKKSFPTAASVRNVDRRSRELLRSYPEALALWWSSPQNKPLPNLMLSPCDTCSQPAWPRSSMQTVWLHNRAK